MSIGPGTVSRFRVVVVAVLRVKQLRRGSKPRIELDEIKHKDASIAMEEVRTGLISFTEFTLPHVQDLNGLGDLTVSVEESLPVGSSAGGGDSLRQMKVMNGLRMFIRSDKGSIEDNVFYSQRSRGPIYRWHYENNPAKWHVVRIDASDWSQHEFCTASWQSVPEGLKAQLSEHYVE